MDWLTSFLFVHVLHVFLYDMRRVMLFLSRYVPRQCCLLLTKLPVQLATKAVPT